MNRVKAIVLFANQWRMRDEITGVVREGVTVNYIMKDNLEPAVNTDGSRGYKIVKENLSINNANKIVKVPGIYEMTYGFMVRGGKPVLKLEEIKFISEVGK